MHYTKFDNTQWDGLFQKENVFIKLSSSGDSLKSIFSVGGVSI